MKGLEAREAEGDDLPADEVADLRYPGPHQVNGEGGGGVHGPGGEAGLLSGVEDGQRAGVEEGDVAQLALLVPCTVKQYSLQSDTNIGKDCTVQCSTVCTLTKFTYL